MARAEYDENCFKILCVGDVHGLWDKDDESAVRGLEPDAVFFVGDYGNESLADVEAVSKFATTAEDTGMCLVAAVLGNHEAIFHGLDPMLGQPQEKDDESAIPALQRDPVQAKTVSGVRDEDAVKQEMKMLDRFNPAFHKRSLKRGAPVVAGRPFSWGGSSFGRFHHIFERYLGLTSMEQSAERIINDVHATPEDSAIFFLSHNGPFGLGSKPCDPCGNDYEPGEEDKGDPDLRAAISEARRMNRRVPLVVFGHFHHRLQGDVGFRTMVTWEPDGESSGGKTTVLVNCAFVPRHELVDGECLHHFMVVLCSKENFEVVSVEEVWVTANGNIRKMSNHYKLK